MQLEIEGMRAVIVFSMSVCLQLLYTKTADLNTSFYPSLAYQAKI